MPYNISIKSNLVPLNLNLRMFMNLLRRTERPGIWPTSTRPSIGRGPQVRRCAHHWMVDNDDSADLDGILIMNDWVMILIDGQIMLFIIG